MKRKLDFETFYVYYQKRKFKMNSINKVPKKIEPISWLYLSLQRHTNIYTGKTYKGFQHYLILAFKNKYCSCPFRKFL